MSKLAHAGQLKVLVAIVEATACGRDPESEYNTFVISYMACLPNYRVGKAVWSCWAMETGPEGNLMGR